jgi:fatty acid desaturase
VASTVAAVCGFLVGGVAACFAFAGFFGAFSKFRMLPEAAAWVTLGCVGVALIMANIGLNREQKTPVQEDSQIFTAV